MRGHFGQGQLPGQIPGGVEAHKGVELDCKEGHKEGAGEDMRLEK